jgi:hypothetical protein
MNPNGGGTLTVPRELSSLLLVEQGMNQSFMQPFFAALAESVAGGYRGYDQSGADAFFACTNRSTTFPTSFASCASRRTSLSDFNTCVAGRTQNQQELADIAFCLEKYNVGAERSPITGGLGTGVEAYQHCLLAFERCQVASPTIWSWMRTWNTSGHNIMGAFAPGGLVISYQGNSNPKLLTIKLPNGLSARAAQVLQPLAALPAWSGWFRGMRNNTFAVDTDMLSVPFSIPTFVAGGCDPFPLNSDATVNPNAASVLPPERLPLVLGGR